MEKKNKEEEYLKETADSLSPIDHCCECRAGIRHMICIQYPDCKCNSKNKEEREEWLRSLE